MEWGKIIGIGVIVLVAILVVLGVKHNQNLEQQRQQAIAQLVSMPQYESCKYDASTCPYVEDNVAFPESTAIGLVILGVLLGLYLMRSDATQRNILKEVSGKREQISKDERRDLVMSVLTTDEQKIINAVREQPGITQATLRLRTDMSKAKLSLLLKELEGRNLIAKTEDGKTNTVHLKREL
jgi:uncharacterized membrane protein